MLNYLLPILAVLAGYLFVLIFKFKKKRSLKLFLAFSGAFLLSITVFNLLPELYHHHENEHIGIFIMLGILLQVFLEFFSKGAEHGHMHFNEKLNSFPWLLFISLSVHSILEGIPIHNHHSLLLGIIVHKIPVAIILSTFFLNADISRTKSSMFLVLFALMTPLGSYLSSTFEFIKDYYFEIAAVVVGIFLHISTVILFESSEGHRFNFRKLTVIILGIICAYFI